MPTGTTPRTATPHGKSLKASMEQLQISKPLRSGAQAQQQEETLRMQQQKTLWMQQWLRQNTQRMRQRQLQQMRQIMQEEMGTDTLTTSPFGFPVDDQWMQLDDPDEVDEVTDKSIQQFIDHFMKKLSSHGL